MTIQKSLGAQSIIPEETPSQIRYFPKKECMGKSSCSPSVKPSMGLASSCEFHVGSDHGIQLIVDLNSNPSEWMRKLENEVHKCRDLQNYMSRTGSFHQELGRLGDVYKRREGPLLWFQGSGREFEHKNLETKEGGHVEGEHSKLSVDLERVEDMKQDQEPSFKQLGLSDVDAENQTVSSSVSCPEEETMNVDFDVPDAQEGTARSENWENLNQKNGGGPVSSTSQVFPGSMESGSVKTQLSIVCPQQSASCVPQENEGLMDVVNRQHSNVDVQCGRSLNSTHLNCETSGNQQPLASAEELERLLLKRQFIGDESCSDCGKPDAKVLRSTNYAAGKVHLRRSSRLVPKNQPNASK